MFKIGCHLSSAKGFLAMGEDAVSIGANTFQFFTRNPRGSKSKKIDENDVMDLIVLMKEHAFAPLIAHAPYTINPCAANPKVEEFTHMVMKEDLANLEYLPGNYYNFHPGSHVGQGIEIGVKKVSSLLNEILRPEQSTTVLLETMAGKGSEVGSRFEELRQILDRVEQTEKMGVCLDVCHVYDAGYNVANHLDHVLEEFDRVIGLSRLYAIHLNDSLNPCGSHKDRHARIGEGSIGLKATLKIINHDCLRHLPFCLETPTDLAGHKDEIALLKKAYVNS